MLASAESDARTCNKRRRSSHYMSVSSIGVNAGGEISGRVLVSERRPRSPADGAAAAAAAAVALGGRTPVPEPGGADAPPRGRGGGGSADSNASPRDGAIAPTSPRALRRGCRRPVAPRLVTTRGGVGTVDPASALPSVVEMMAEAGRVERGALFARMDPSGIVREWRDDCALTGWSREDTKDRNIIENFVLPELRPKVQGFFDDVIRGHSNTFILEVKTKYEETIFLLIDTHPVRDTNDENSVVGVIANARDVTREIMYDMAVRAMAADNRRLIETANAPIFAVDESMRVSEWNEYSAATTGFVGDEVLGRPFAETLVAPRNRALAESVLGRVLREGERTDGQELEIRTNNRGENRIWVVNVTPRLDLAGNVFGATGVAKDVTDDRRLADQLKRMEITNKAQERTLDSERGVTAHFAHELRNPLHAIDSALQAMPDDAPDSTKSLVEAMQLCTNFMSSVMNNLLDIRKLEEGKMILKEEPMSISRLLKEVHGMLAPSVREGVLFSVDCRTEGRDWILGDPHRIQQVLTNVVTNAIKYTVAGSIVLRALWENGTVRIECADTGPGIPKNEQEKMFEKFVQGGGAPGSGLGLAIAKSVVDLCGGSICFDSDPVQRAGTTCMIMLPLEPCESPSSLHEEDSTGVSIKDALTFLIIDDIAVNRAMLSRRIKKGIAPNAAVWEAQNGEEGLELCRRERFDVILVDHYMGEAGGVMVGSDTVVAMRRMGVDAVIIGCSGTDSNTLFQDAGCDLLWGKPIPSNEMVVNQLSKLISQKRKALFT